MPLILTEIVGDFGYKEFANKGGIHNFAIGTVGYLYWSYILPNTLTTGFASIIGKRCMGRINRIIGIIGRNYYIR